VVSPDFLGLIGLVPGASLRTGSVNDALALMGLLVRNSGEGAVQFGTYHYQRWVTDYLRLLPPWANADREIGEMGSQVQSGIDCKPSSFSFLRITFVGDFTAILSP
jgi:hypothetical protein